MRARVICFLLSLVVLAGSAGLATARDQVPAEERDVPWTGIIPDCNSDMVLLNVSERFARTESTFWNSSLTITAYDHVKPIAFRPWGLDYIPRRFCSARALMSDGYKRTVYYSVREALGDPGLFRTEWGIEYCVVGLDREWQDAPLCKMAKP
ncbi:hypothetical protein [Chelatococcus reniformis]|uniref:Uncharacterized protein n=1 Tax=Chelatococcus reniformis TaxID=1494448 RepID=A0A916UNF0_9HYPH|nr:hypothetical protein [Chelatococcus reniformis]GGC80244.1 hypothetical protein GCM10010994_42790 [Chelatococcus reniformis]